MGLLEQHSSLLRNAPEPTRLQVFEELLRGDITSAVERIQQSLASSRIEAEEIAINIFEWMKLYRDNRP